MDLPAQAWPSTDGPRAARTGLEPSTPSLWRRAVRQLVRRLGGGAFAAPWNFL